VNNLQAAHSWYVCNKIIAVCKLQVARTMAPSVIYIDQAEKVFISDKKKLKEFGSQVRMCVCVNRMWL